jgi:rubrerythrin
MVNKIYDIIEDMEDELDGAEEYAEASIRCKDSEHYAAAKIYVLMAEDEMTHFEKLEDMLKTHIVSIEGEFKKFVTKKHSALAHKYAEVKLLVDKASQ